MGRSRARSRRPSPGANWGTGSMSDAFATVWHPGSGTQWVRWGMSGDEFKAQDTAYFDLGLRVTSLVIKNGKLAAVWHPGSGAQWVRWGMSGDELRARDT